MNNASSRYKWYILALGTATHILIAGIPNLCMPVLFQEISADLGLSLTQVGIIWGMVGLPGLFTSLFIGMLGDRFGSRKTLFVACILVGIAGALRGAATGYNSLLVITFLFGLAFVPFSFGVHKSAGEWFSGKQLGMANGILAMGVGVGNALGSMLSATVFSPALGGWRNVLYLYGVIAVVLSFFWLRTRKPPEVHVEASSTSAGAALRQSLKRIIHIKSVWIMAFAFMCFGACYAGVVGYLPLYLRDSGWSPARADGALTALTAASVAGVIPLSMLSDKIGSRKKVIYASILVYILSIGLLSRFNTSIIWLLVVLVGIVQEGLISLFITVVMETEGIGGIHSGTALGLTMTLSGLGSFLGPSFGNRLAVIKPGYAFLFWAGLAIVILVLIFFVKETGWKKSGRHSEVESTV